MNQLELEYARKRKNKTLADMAAATASPWSPYAKKRWAMSSSVMMRKSLSPGARPDQRTGELAF